MAVSRMVVELSTGRLSATCGSNRLIVLRLSSDLLRDTYPLAHKLLICLKKIVVRWWALVISLLGGDDTFKEITMSRSISTDHFLLDGMGLTLRVFGNEISLLHGGSELIVERLSDGHSWNWERGKGRWTQRGDDWLDGWKRR
jgi:hypothetical protein